MSPSRELALAVGGCAGGAGLAWYAASRTWLVVVQPQPVPLPTQSHEVTGAALSGWLPALALAAFAGAAALLAVRGAGRLLVGALLGGAGVGMIVATMVVRVSSAGAGGSIGWPVLCVAGGVLVLGAGAATLWRGRNWPAMGARYERAGRATVEPTAQLWDALDRGDDPTLRG